MKICNRIKRLNELIMQMDLDQDIRRRDIERVLLPDEFERFLIAWEVEKSSRKDKPDAIKEYEARLKVADLHYTKMDKFSSQYSTNKSLGSQFAQKSSAAYEGALEYLRERLDVSPDIQLWLDRGVDSIVDLTPASLPRCINSKSGYSLSSVNPMTKRIRDIKRDALAGALNQLQLNDESLPVGSFKSSRILNTSNFEF